MKNQIQKGIIFMALLSTVVGFSSETFNEYYNVTNPIDTFNAAPSNASRPVIRVKNNLLLVSQMTFEAQEVNIKLYFNSNTEVGTPNELIYSEEVVNASVLERIYSLNNRAHGEYKVVLTTPQGQFSELFYL